MAIDVREPVAPLMRDASPLAARPSARAMSWIRVTAWAVGLSVAIAQAIYYRNWVNADSTSYLDMSDAITTGAWNRLVNTTWSPLYPALVGVLRLAHSGPSWDFPSAHLAVLLTFVLAFVCFEFFLRRVIAAAGGEDDGELRAVPAWMALAVGYALFLWAALGMLGLMKPTPDMMMSAFVYLALGLLLQIRGGDTRARTFAVLGAVLGLGYLSKAFMFPLGVLMLATVAVFQRVRGRLPRVLLAAGVMLVIAGPYAALLSRRMHKLTFGEAGTVVHLSAVDNAGPTPYWQELGGASGRFIRAPKRIFDDPPAFALDTTLAVTRIFWYDPGYLVAGARPGFHLRHQARVLLDNLALYAGVLLDLRGVLAALIIVLVVVGWREAARGAASTWPLWWVAGAALGAYALIHVETRYIGAFFAVLFLAVLMGLRLPARIPRAVLVGAAVAIVADLAVSTIIQITRDATENYTKTEIGDLEAARALHRAGIAPGTRVARINPRVADGWARLARVSIVAEVQHTKTDRFWGQPPAAQQRLLDAFAATGAKAVVAFFFPRPNTLAPGWQWLGRTNYAVHVLGEPAPTADTRVARPRGHS